MWQRTLLRETILKFIAKQKFLSLQKNSLILKFLIKKKICEICGICVTKKGGDYEKATHHRADGEGLSSRAHSIPDGHRHHLVYGSRPDSILNSNLPVSPRPQSPTRGCGFVLFINRATLPLCHFATLRITQLANYKDITWLSASQ